MKNRSKIVFKFLRHRFKVRINQILVKILGLEILKTAKNVLQNDSKNKMTNRFPNLKRNQMKF